jgi:DNA-binding MarR family transcriptional regulator
MNEQFFSLKRAHHGVLRVLRRPFASFGLTAARYDLMFILARGHDRPTQACRLRRELGVCASVVSRMLRRLEQQGLVRRTPNFVDHRKRDVALTAQGLRCVTECRGSLRRPAMRLLHQAITFCTRWHKNPRLCRLGAALFLRWDRDAGFAQTCHLDGFLRALRRAFFDTASLYYPWHPDD